MANMNTSDELLRCPITMELFSDPVLAQDGHTYERQAIEQWIRSKGTSPITRQPLSIEQLYPNRAVKGLVDVFETLIRQKNYQFILDVDVKKKKGRPLFQVNGKTIYGAEWLSDNNKRPEIILLKINGVRARKEASFYVDISRHPHIIRTFGFVYDPNIPDQDKTVLLLQEYASGGSLYELLDERRTAPDEKILIQMFLQIIEAMIYLASNHVVHGDSACRNVLVFRFDKNQPEKNVVKITDFGLSRHSQLYSTTPGVASTTLNIVPVRYAAPEVLSTNTTSEAYTEKSDVYSMGVLMWEAYSRGSLPWMNTENDADVIRRVRNGDLLPQPPNCSQSFWSIITQTWSTSPMDRPTFNELKHLLAEQYYRSDWMLENNSGRYPTNTIHDLPEIRRKEGQRHQEEQDRKLAQRHQEEQDRKLAQRHQEEQDRKIAQEYSLLEKRNEEEQLRSVARAEEPKSTVPKYKSSYSALRINCRGRACAQCGECRDWYWRPDGKYRKKYTKRGDATCLIDGRRRIDVPDRSGDWYGSEDGGNGAGNVCEDVGSSRFYYHVGYRSSGIYGRGRLCACDDNLS